MRNWIAGAMAGMLILGPAGCSEVPSALDEYASSPLAKKGGDRPPKPEEPTSEWPIVVTFADRIGDQIRSDAELRPDLTEHSYRDGECGVWANIGNLDDARFDPDGDWKRRLANQCGSERLIVFEFDPPHVPADTARGPFVNVEDICTMTVGEVRTGVSAQFNLCGVLLFDGVRAERTTADTWVVSADGPDAAATCSGDGTRQNMPFALTITLLEPGC